MAVRDGDTAVWLNNKLGSVDDRWCSVSICSQLTKEKLQGSIYCFHTLQPYVKIKFLLSLLHLPKRNVQEWKVELDEIIQMAIEDSEPWVSMIANILKLFPETGMLSTEIEERHQYFHELVADLRKNMKKMQDSSGIYPLECLYLSRNSLQSVIGAQLQPTKHFALQRKPKSAELRADLIQKSVEAASSMKKGGISIPVKQRSFAKKFEDINSLPKTNADKTSVGFLKPSSVSSRIGSSTPLGNRTNNRREGGIKLLELEEMPVGGKEAKRRRKAAEQEAAEQIKKEKLAANVTPDYAASLMSPGLPTMTSIVIGAPSTSYFPGAVPLKPKPEPAAASTAIITSSVGATTLNAVNSNFKLPLPGMASLLADSQKPVMTVPSPVAIVNAQTIVLTTPQQQQIQQQQQQQQPLPVVSATVVQQIQPQKGLSLTREQMLEAQEMFRVSNKVTRPEKALILGFMAGSRENPSPQQGDIINIRLSETLESIEQPDGTFRPMYVDVFFQMNYATGDWKRVKKFREASSE